MNKPQKKIIRPLKEFQWEFQEALINHRRVKVNGLGIFEVRDMAPRRSRNPATGAVEIMPGYTRVRFVPTKSLKMAVQKV